MQLALGPAPLGNRFTRVVLRVSLGILASTGLYTAGFALAPYAGPALLIVPLPGLLLAMHAPLECGLWLLLTGAAVTLGLGVDAAAGLVLLFGIPALAIAAGFRRRWSIEGTVLAAVATWSAGITTLAFLAYGDVTTLIAVLRDQLTNGVEVALSTYGSLGVAETTVATAHAQRDLLVNGLLEVLPALIVLCGGLMTIANVVLLRGWIDGPRDVDLRMWRTPEHLIWALIGTGFTMFLPWPVANLIARNLFLVLLGCYFCQGLAIVSYFLERLRLPRGIRVAGYLLIAAQHIIAAIVLALGVFDLWGNFRRLSAGSADIQISGDGE